MSTMSTGLMSEEKGQRAGGAVLGPKWDGYDTFTVPEAGEILRVSRWAAYAAAKAGTLPVVWIGKRCIVPRYALEKLLGA